MAWFAVVFAIFVDVVDVLGDFGLQRNNVCPTVLDYATIDINWRCWYNPNVGASTEEIVRRHGYPFEAYKVTADDGYVVTVFRIPRGKDNEKFLQIRPPVFLQHGIMQTSNVWVSIPRKSLAFKLADIGYDVWLGNARGCKYSLEHTALNSSNEAYWNFSFHEMGEYDLPAVMNFIAGKTEMKRKVVYVGHSMGTTMSFVYASLKPDHAEKKLAGIISLAPVAFLTQVNSSIAILSPVAEMLQEIFNTFGKYSIGRDDHQRQFICTWFPLIEPCKILYFSIFGVDYEEYEAEDIPIVIVNYQSTTSGKAAVHYAQEIRDKGRFQWYDYGEWKNMDKYDAPHPPLYPLKKISVPIHLFYGTRDVLAGEQDVKFLFETLETTNKSIHFVINGEGRGFNHLDFLLAKNINTTLHVPVIELIEKMSPA